MIPLPVHQGDVCGSLLGAMLFPNDRAKAESYAAQLLTKRPLQDYLQAGYGFAFPIPFLDALGRDLSSKEIERQTLHGQRVGEVVKTLWALICSHPDIASWDSAICVVEDASVAVGLQTSRATLRAHLAELRAVLHFWGAFALRNYQFIVEPTVGYNGMDDLRAFVSEAMALLQQLCHWRNSRNMPDKLLAGDVVGPWIGWDPHQPQSGWPDTGRLYAISLHPGVRVPVRRPSGRPPNRQNSVR